MCNAKMRIAIILVLINFVAISSCVIDPETGLIISVGDGSAPSGSENISVDVSMDNEVPVKGIQMDICYQGDNLTCTGCETTGRAAAFNCESNELRNGCVRIIIYSLEGNIIDVGTGPLFSLIYDVADGAPSECIYLTPIEAKVSDETKLLLDTTIELGEFCIE